MFTSPTIKDIARITGVHFTTVSMALRGHPAVAQSTRLRIENAAKLLGYRRNEVFSALSRQRRHPHPSREVPTILYLGRARRNDDFFDMAHHQQLVTGATREAKALGYQLKTALVSAVGVPPERLQGYLLRSTAVGIVVGAWDPILEVPDVDWTRTPAVKIDSRHVPAQVPFVSFDQMKCVIDSFRKTHALGYRRIGIALGEKDEDATDGLHLSGWLVAQREFPRLAKIPPLFFPPGASQKMILPLLDEWTRQYRIDVVLCNWRSITKLLNLLRPHPAGRIASVCLCCSPDEPHIAGIQPNFDLVGQRAVSLLGTLINAPNGRLTGAPLTSYVEGTWHDGPSIQTKN